MLLFSTAALSAFETGQASWYGGKFQGRQTANGEIFDTNLLTAAHKTLPFNTVVKVTNLKNNKSVDVRINDRGPFIEGRIIDLSRAAASQIDMTVSGVAPVKLEIISLPDGHTESGLKKTEEVHPEGIPESYKIQIASFSNAENAQRCIDKLKNSGLSAEVEISDRGMMRIIISGIKETELDSFIERIERTGYGSPLIRHN